jgi:putative cardiolipin synthase
MASPLRLFAALLFGWMTGRTQLPEREHVPRQTALPPPASEFANLVHALLAAHPGLTGFRLLDSGLDAFVARIVMIERAQSSIDLQYYLFHDDMVGKLIADKLMAAADRGVRVRVLIDDWGMAGRDDGLLALSLHPHLSIRLFNPFASRRQRVGEIISDFGRITRRMHNKSLTVDGLASIVGGRNIGNEYFDADPEVAFGDMDALMIGPIVSDVAHSFDAYWNSDVSYPIELIHHRRPNKRALDRYRKTLASFAHAARNSAYAERAMHSELADDLRRGDMHWQWGRASLIADDPRKVMLDYEDHSTHLLPQLVPVVDALQQELLIFSPYFIPGEQGVAFFRALHERGIRITVVTNSLASTDVGIVHAGYAKYRKPLLAAGVTLYEVRAHSKSRLHLLSGASRASLHAKTFVFDRRTVFIGSLNLDPRSAHINTEIGVLIQSPVAAAAMAVQVSDHISDAAYRVTLEDGELLWEAEGQRFTHEPDASWLRRLGLWLLSPFLIESQL